MHFLKGDAMKDSWSYDFLNKPGIIVRAHTHTQHTHNSVPVYALGLGWISQNFFFFYLLYQKVMRILVIKIKLTGGKTLENIL